MGACIILTPVIITAWPMLAAAVTSAAVAAGFSMEKQVKAGPNLNSVDLAMENMDVVGESLGHDQQITIKRDGVILTFSRDAAGQFKTQARGTQSRAELETIGREMAGMVIQQYVYRRLNQELANQGFEAIEEEQAADQTIHLHVRRYPM